jgi:hypothetical protein
MASTPITYRCLCAGPMDVEEVRQRIVNNKVNMTVPIEGPHYLDFSNTNTSKVTSYGFYGIEMRRFGLPPTIDLRS